MRNEHVPIFVFLNVSFPNLILRPQCPKVADTLQKSAVGTPPVAAAPPIPDTHERVGSFAYVHSLTPTWAIRIKINS